MKNAITAYARLHVTPPHLTEVVNQALLRIQSFPLKYRFLCHVVSFIIEFFMPLSFGYLSRFSTLSQKDALTLILRLQNTSHLTGRILISLFKIPILLSLKKEYLSE